MTTPATASAFRCGCSSRRRRLPTDHAGEDAAAQLAVMRRYGGAGIVPSGAYHLESQTTVTDRRMEAWELLFTAPQEPA